jgi:hypothetical protein
MMNLCSLRTAILLVSLCMAAACGGETTADPNPAPSENNGDADAVDSSEPDAEDGADAGQEPDAVPDAGGMEDVPGESDAEADSVDDDADPAPEPELPVAPVDDFSETACGLFDAETTVLTAVADERDAGQVIFLPSQDQAYTINLPEEGPGYVTLQVPEWHAELAFYTHLSSAGFTILSGAQRLTPVRYNPECQEQGITDQRHLFHEWGAFVIEFDADAPRQLTLSVIMISFGQ